MSASVAIWQARLSLVQAAITALLTGGAQEYEIDGVKVTKLQLRELTAEETRLTGLIRRAGRTGGAFRVGSPL